MPIGLEFLTTSSEFRKDPKWDEPKARRNQLDYG